MRHKMIRLSFGAIALGCTALFIIGMTPTDAKPFGLQNKGLCSMVGTWHGEDYQGNTWMTMYTPGRNAIYGQVTGEFVLFDPTLGGFFPDAVRVTNPFGVWKKVGWRTYQYTTRAYGLDQDGGVVYTWRVSGETELVDCDYVDSTFVMELWLGDADISTDPPIFCVPGTAWEIRMPLVQASCED
jgi:hypothetical protein